MIQKNLHGDIFLLVDSNRCLQGTKLRQFDLSQDSESYFGHMLECAFVKGTGSHLFPFSHVHIDSH